jgi:hypothetical protein
VPVKIVPVAQHISFGNKFTLCFHKQNYYMFYRHANVQRTYISLSLTNLSSCCPQCWKMSCSASSIAARKYLTNYLRRKFSCTLQEIFVISSTGMAYHLYLLFTPFASRDCLVPRLKLITLCSTIEVSYLTYTLGISIFEFCYQEDKYII